MGTSILIHSRLQFAILTLLTLVATSAAHAQCALPHGVAGEQFYNTTHNVMQYCNGSDWVNMGAIGGGGGSCRNVWGASDNMPAAMVNFPKAIRCSSGNREAILQSGLYDSSTNRIAYTLPRMPAEGAVYFNATTGAYISTEGDNYSTGCSGIADLRTATSQHVDVCSGGGGVGGAGLPGGCANDQVAKWNGAAWVCAPDETGGGGGSDTLAGLSCTTNQIAKWNGTAWVCATDETGGGGAGCVGGRLHLEVWPHNGWPYAGCGQTSYLYQCKNGVLTTLATVTGDCGGG